MNEIFTTKQINEFLKEINDDDLKKMFNSSNTSAITLKPQNTIEEKLTEYWSYEVPVLLGDIVEINNKTYTVTCIYTDNTVDLLSEDIKKVNRGLYKVPLTVVGKLECITVQEA